MIGIRLDKPILYKHASLRYFDAHEHHAARFSGDDDILILVFEGVLRFAEDGVGYELHPGEYFIQRHGCRQDGELESDSPAYLYVHFHGEHAESGDILPQQGTFSPEDFAPHFDRMDSLYHSKASYIEQCAEFYTILAMLRRNRQEATVAEEMAAYLDENSASPPTLAELAEKFHFSRNHVINIFRASYGMTPFEYLNRVRIRKAERLLEVTSRTAESISAECGFCDYSHFYRTFRQITGTSPKRWRELRRLEPFI